MKLVKSLQSAAFAAWLPLVMATPADANIISSYTVNGNGTVTYSYTIDNVGGNFDIAIWSLQFGFSQPDWDQSDASFGGNVHVPNANWTADKGIPIEGESAQDFLSVSPIGDVGLGQTLGTFSFTSSHLPGTISFYEFSAGGDSLRGTTIGPVSSVPEGNGPYEAIALAAFLAFAAKAGHLRRVETPV